jgi:hypothetical protein
VVRISRRHRVRYSANPRVSCPGRFAYSVSCEACCRYAGAQRAGPPLPVPMLPSILFDSLNGRATAPIKQLELSDQVGIDKDASSLECRNAHGAPSSMSRSAAS